MISAWHKVPGWLSQLTWGGRPVRFFVHWDFIKKCFRWLRFHGGPPSSLLPNYRAHLSYFGPPGFLHACLLTAEAALSTLPGEFIFFNPAQLPSSPAGSSLFPIPSFQLSLWVNAPSFLCRLKLCNPYIIPGHLFFPFILGTNLIVP